MGIIPPDHCLDNFWHLLDHWDILITFHVEFTHKPDTCIIVFVYLCVCRFCVCKQVHSKTVALFNSCWFVVYCCSPCGGFVFGPYATLTPEWISMWIWKFEIPGIITENDAIGKGKFDKWIFYDPSNSVLQMVQMLKNACESYQCVANETRPQNTGI